MKIIAGTVETKSALKIDANKLISKIGLVIENGINISNPNQKFNSVAIKYLLDDKEKSIKYTFNNDGPSSLSNNYEKDVLMMQEFVKKGLPILQKYDLEDAYYYNVANFIVANFTFALGNLKGIINAKITKDILSTSFDHYINKDRVLDSLSLFIEFPKSLSKNKKIIEDILEDYYSNVDIESNMDSLIHEFMNTHKLSTSWKYKNKADNTILIGGIGKYTNFDEFKELTVIRAMPYGNEIDSVIKIIENSFDNVSILSKELMDFKDDDQYWVNYSVTPSKELLDDALNLGETIKNMGKPPKYRIDKYFFEKTERIPAKLKKLGGFEKFFKKKK